MDIPVAPCRQVLNRKIPDLARLCTKIGDIDDDEPFCVLGIDQGKNKVRTAKSGVHYLYRIGKFEASEFLCNRGTEPVIGKEGISTPCNHNFRKQHKVNTHWMSFWATILLSSSMTIMWVAHETHGSYARTTSSATCHGAPVRARLQVGKFQVVGTSIS